MKKYIICICLFHCIGFSLAQPVFYSGLINQKVSINMRLEIQSVYEFNNGESYHSGFEISGYYYLVNSNKKIYVEGRNNKIVSNTINSDSIIRLNEYTDLEYTGYFLGKFNKNGNYQGDWYSIDGKKQYPFLLKVNQNATIVYKKDHSLIYPQFKGLKSKRIERNINSILSNLKSGVQIDEVAPDNFQRREYTFEILYNQKNIFTYSWNQAMYEDSTYHGFLIHNTGGFSSYNIQTGKKITYEDVLIKGSEKYIDELIVNGINEFCHYKSDIYTIENIRNTLCVTETGLLFPYKACSSTGKYEQDWSIEIPFSDIKSYLNPSGLLKNMFPVTASK